jgi:type I restriction enzyme S subunit
MNPNVFFENFELLADAPNGVKKLRGLILQLAIQGKLVPQDQNDDPASILIERIKAEKNELVKGTVAQRKSQSRIDINNIPYDLPINWEWIRFGDVVICRDGERIPVARSERENREKLYDYYGASGVIDQIDNYLFDKSLLLIGEDGANLLNRSTPIAFIAEGKYWVNNHAHVIDGISLDFLRYLEVYINAIDLSPYVTGSAQPKMNQAKMNSIPIAIPPLAEQKRIVSKVDELMTLCDKLEARRQKKQELQSKLNNAALDRMLSAENQEEFEQEWQRICENFDLLYDNPENVEKLKKYILKLGVEGKLVPTESEIAKNEGRDYESADSLLKIALINLNEKETNLKNQNNFESIELSNSDETLPEGWIWTSIGQVTQCLDHMRIPVNKKEREERVGNIPYYGANGRVGWIDNYIFDEPLVLVVEDETFIGRQKPFCYKIVGNSWVNNHAHVLRPTEAVDVDFLNYSLAYYPFIPLTSGTTGRKKLNKSTLIAAPYKLPPLAEQKRIIEKVEQLMVLCDELETKLRKEREDSEKLMEAVVKDLLEEAAA